MAIWLTVVPVAAQRATAPAAGAPLVAAPAQATGHAQPKVDSGDTAWMLTSAALVLMMTAPGLALFYGGMVRQHNVLGTIMQSFILMAVISIQWVLWGYSVAFGPDFHGITGSLAWIGLKGVGLEPYPDYAATIPHQAFMIYQLMFAIITRLIMAFAERSCSAVPRLHAALGNLHLRPLAHWVWGVGGWLNAGAGLRAHGGPHQFRRLCAGLRLDARQTLGLRQGTHAAAQSGYRIGAAMLWSGSANAGSALGRPLATSAFVVTHTATAAATRLDADGWLSRGGPSWGLHPAPWWAGGDHARLRDTWGLSAVVIGAWWRSLLQCV
jgi:Amt family ammonium transporter